MRGGWDNWSQAVRSSAKGKFAVSQAPAGTRLGRNALQTIGLISATHGLVRVH